MITSMKTNKNVVELFIGMKASVWEAVTWMGIMDCFRIRSYSQPNSFSTGWSINSRIDTQLPAFVYYRAGERKGKKRLRRRRFAGIMMILHCMDIVGTYRKR
jgi:hypothetical protein